MGPKTPIAWGMVVEIPSMGEQTMGIGVGPCDAHSCEVVFVVMEEGRVEKRLCLCGHHHCCL